MRKALIFTLSIFLVFTFTMPSFATVSVSAKAAVVICADSLEVVYSKNADERLSMASTTKIMTALLALENGADDAVITVTDEMVNVEGTSMGLKSGDSVSLIALVKGMLISSGNDAANAVAFAVSGGIQPFSELMNARAEEIGMNNTHFVTPSGLDAEEHYSTAYDMALLAAHALRNPKFLNICSSKSVTAYYGNPPYRRVMTNHNKLLSLSDDYIGVKTGFTKKSGRCLVSAKKQNGKTLIAVTLGAPDDWNDHIKLYDYSFPLVESNDLTENLDDLTVTCVGGRENAVRVVPAEDAEYTYVNKNAELNCKIYVKQFEYAPVACGEALGRIDFFDTDGVLIKSVDLVAEKYVSCLKE